MRDGDKLSEIPTWLLRIVVGGALAAVGFGAGGVTLGGVDRSPAIVVQLTLPDEYEVLARELPERIATLEGTVRSLDKSVGTLNMSMNTLLFERRQP